MFFSAPFRRGEAKTLCSAAKGGKQRALQGVNVCYAERRAQG